MKLHAALLAAVLTFPFGNAPDPGPRPDSVFMVVSLDEHRGGELMSTGTGFVIDGDGAAVTNSHVVSASLFNGWRMYGVFAGRGVAYDLSVECASPLKYSGDVKLDVGDLSRDVAVVRLHRMKAEYVQYMPGRWAARGDVALVPLSFESDDVRPGATLEVDGYGVRDRTPLSEWTTVGSADDSVNLLDGTKVVAAVFSVRPTAGDSGAPVLDILGNVVGVWTWSLDPHTGVMQDTVGMGDLCEAGK